MKNVGSILLVLLSIHNAGAMKPQIMCQDSKDIKLLTLQELCLDKVSEVLSREISGHDVDGSREKAAQKISSLLDILPLELVEKINAFKDLKRMKSAGWFYVFDVSADHAFCIAKDRRDIDFGKGWVWKVKLDTLEGMESYNLKIGKWTEGSLTNNDNNLLLWNGLSNQYICYDFSAKKNDLIYQIDSQENLHSYHSIGTKTFIEDGNAIILCETGKQAEALLNAPANKKFIFLPSRNLLLFSLYTRDANCLLQGLDITHKSLYELERMEYPLCAIAADQSTTIAVSDMGGAITVLDVNNVQKPLRKASLHHADTIFAICFEPDGRHLLGGAANGDILIWNIATENCVFHQNAFTDQSVHKVYWSSDSGSIIAKNNTYGEIVQYKSPLVSLVSNYLKQKNEARQVKT